MFVYRLPGREDKKLIKTIFNSHLEGLERKKKEDAGAAAGDGDGGDDDDAQNVDSIIFHLINKRLTQAIGGH